MKKSLLTPFQHLFLLTKVAPGEKPLEYEDVADFMFQHLFLLMKVAPQGFVKLREQAHLFQHLFLLMKVATLTSTQQSWVI
jgi:hypothetical protein